MEFVKAIYEIDEEFIQTLHEFIPENAIPPEDTDEDLVNNEAIFYPGMNS